MSIAMKLKTGGIITIKCIPVIVAFRMSVNILSFLYEFFPVTKAVEALRSIIIGDSISIANDPAMPKAARLNLASLSRAMKEIRIGCSRAIINHVRARGLQKRKILSLVNLSGKFVSMRAAKIGIY